MSAEHRDSHLVTPRRRVQVVILLAMLARLAVAPFTEDPWDLQIWRDTGTRVLAAQSPYVEGDLPYAYPPPWAGWCAFATAVAGPAHPQAWRVLLKLPPILADGVLAWGLLSLGSLGATAAVIVALGPPFFLISALWGQFDALPACFTLLALLAMRRRRFAQAGLLFGMASVWKLLYPAFAVPWLMSCVWRAHGRRTALRFVLIFTGVLAVGVLPALIGDPVGFLRVLAFQAERGPQGLTVWPLVAHLWPRVAHIGDYLVPVALVLGNAALIWRRRHVGVPAAWEAAWGLALVTALFLATSKVVNEQYLLWLASPLLAAWVLSAWRSLGMLVALSLGMVTVYLFMHVAPDLTGIAPGWWRGETFPLYEILLPLGLAAWIGHILTVWGLTRSVRVQR